MINLQELRIGNWINVNYQDGIKPLMLTNNSLGDLMVKDEFEINIIDCSLIELTPKLIEKFGFKFIDIENGSIFKLKDLYIKFRNDLFKFIINTQTGIIAIGIKFKYLHQLQNIFHSLTGIELNDVVAYNYFLTKVCGDNITTFEEFLQNPEKILQETLQFIGLPNYPNFNFQVGKKNEHPPMDPLFRKELYVVHDEDVVRAVLLLE